MSRISTIPEIREMESDTVIQAVSGTLTFLRAPKRGQGDRGPWSFQNGELASGGQTIRVCFKDREELPLSMKGKKITILACNGDRGWTGVYASDNEYKGDVTREIKVTKTAEVTVGGTAKEVEPSDNDGETNDSQPDRKRSPAPYQHPGPNNPAGVYGGTVGMAIKEATAIVNALGTDPFTTMYCKQVKQIASNIIRISLTLEKGQLSDPPWAGEKAAPAPKPAPEVLDVDPDELPM